MLLPCRIGVERFAHDNDLRLELEHRSVFEFEWCTDRLAGRPVVLTGLDSGAQNLRLPDYSGRGKRTPVVTEFGARTSGESAMSQTPLVLKHIGGCKR